MATSTERGRARPVCWTAGMTGATLVVISLSGCGRPQVASEHRDLILQVATGTSTRDLGIIGRAAEEIDQLSAAGELSDVEEEAFRSIVEAAGEGEWDRARRLAYALRDAQRPTEADRQRIADRTLPGMKDPGRRQPGGPTGQP